MKKQKEGIKSAIDKLQECVNNLKQAHGYLGQYGCHLCVCVEDIPVPTEGTADKVLKKVENILKEACPSLSSNVIDRAHRIGSNYKCFKTNNTCRSVIVRFNSFKHGILFYRNRNKLKGIWVKLDLTKKRCNVLRSARSIADENQEVNYVFADKNGTSDFFKDINILNELIEKCML